MINLASKKQNYYTCSSIKEKPLELQRSFIPHLGGLNMTCSDRFSILVAWTEYRFKKHRFSLLKLGETAGFRGKTLCKLYIYIRIEKYVFWDSRFLKLFLYFRSETRILKNRLCKSQNALDWSCRNNIWWKQPFVDVLQKRWS